MLRRDLLSGGLALLACGKAVAASASEALPSAAGIAQKPARPGRPEALNILRDGSAPISLDDYLGQLVVLNFWGPWCLPCRKEMPSLARLTDSLDPRRIVILPVALDWRGPSSVRRFYAETGIDVFPVLMGDGPEMVEAFGEESLPSTFVLSPGGAHISSVIGEARWDDPATRIWLDGLAQS